MTTRDPDENGWSSSASAWIENTNIAGSFHREFVLDDPLLERIQKSGAKTVLDVGCGEGRFCRKLNNTGIKIFGIDPIFTMIETAERLHPEGAYSVGFAEELPYEDKSFELVLSCLALTNVNDVDAAISEMTRVLKPKGRILVGTLSGFATAHLMMGKRICKDTGETLYPLGSYLKAQQYLFKWGDLRVQNWHRPLSSYMQAFLAQGLKLTHFDEPRPTGGPWDQLLQYNKMPTLMVMEWEKP